ncbi:MAG: Mov34/MPN/PAD-1 family protein [Chitinophagales bacterium]
MIRIIKERKVRPQALPYPLENAAFKVSMPKTSNTPIINSQLQVFIHQAVYESIWKHVVLDLDNELGGALLGYYGERKGQKFILITDVLNQPPEYFTSSTMIRFTRQFYDDLEYVVDGAGKQGQQLLRLGLYHTHPNFGVFLSVTDAQTFKGIFKDAHQIAMVVDPVQRQDGVFFWIGEDISKRAGFRLYTTTNPKYAPHHVPTNNAMLAKYNLQLKLGQVRISPKITHVRQGKTPIKGINAASHTGHQGKTPPQRESLNLGGFLNQDQPSNLQLHPKEHISISPMNAIPRMCLLYNMRYKNTQITLRNYLGSLRDDTNQVEFPYLTFINKNIMEQTQRAIQNHTGVIGVLEGQFCFDKHKNQYFLYVDLVHLHQLKKPTTNPAGLVQKVLGKYPKHNVFGWIYAAENLPKALFPLYDMHKRWFNKKHNLGLLLKTESTPLKNPPKQLALEQMNLVAYDKEKKAPYNYFKHVFLFNKPY